MATRSIGFSTEENKRLRRIVQRWLAAIRSSIVNVGGCRPAHCHHAITSMPRSFLLAVLLVSPSVLKAQVQIGSDIGGTPGDRSGTSVSLSSDGSRLAIGAPLNSDIGNRYGQVRVFERNGNEWTKIGGNIVGGAEGDRIGEVVSLSGDGSRVAIGAPFNDDNGTASGQVGVYELIGEEWTKIGDSIVGDAALDQSGTAVSLSADGNRVAIGAPFNNDNGDRSGHVRIFELNQEEWTKLGDNIIGEAADDRSGFAVSLSADGNRVAIGAQSNDDNGERSGNVRVFELQGSNWTKVGNSIVGDGAGDQSGAAVSLSADGNRVAIGAPFNDDNGEGSGNVRIFELNGAEWMKVGDSIVGDQAFDQSGRAVSLSADGERVAIGAPGNNDNGDDSGQVRVFQLRGTDWIQVSRDLDGQSSGDKSGSGLSLSADGNRVAVGAPFNANNGPESGNVQVFETRLVGRWSFRGINPLTDVSGNFSDLELSGNARIDSGLLMVAGVDNMPTDYARSDGQYSGVDISDKTLVVCLALTGLDDVGTDGSALTLSSQDGSVFDGIVFAELESNRWLAGSNNYRRTQNFDPGFEESATGEFVQLAISYQNSEDQVQVVGYRNETEIGRYETASPSQFIANDTAVNFGLRHLRNGEAVGALLGAIAEASVYDLVLGQQSIAKLSSQCAAPPALLFENGFEPMIPQ